MTGRMPAIATAAVPVLSLAPVARPQKRDPGDAPVVYDLATGAVLTQDVNSRVERLAPDDCPVHGTPIGFASDETVALDIVSSDDVDAVFRCRPKSRWEIDVRTGELRRSRAR